MKNRLLSKLQALKRKKQKAFCAFLTLGYPNLGATEKLLHEFEKAGVDIIELGFPFSDPLADGPTIQYSSQRSLEKGVKMQDAFSLVARARRQGLKIPVLYFGYFNPIYRYGWKAFVQRAKESGLDGMIVPDLPPGEEPDFDKECLRRQFAQVHLVAPTTVRERAAWIAKKSQGFIYYVSIRGVTGARKLLSQDLKEQLKMLRKITRKPILVGFGVSEPEQAKQICAQSDGIIVGSAIIQRLRDSKGKIQEAVKFVAEMVAAIKS